MVGIGQCSCLPNLKLLASAVPQILKGTAKFWGTPIAQGHIHFFFGVGFYDGPWQNLSSHANFEVVSFSRCRNIIGKPQGHTHFFL